MTRVMIGIDPHKSSHTAVAMARVRSRWASCGCAPARPRRSSCWGGRRGGRSGPGRWRAPPGWGTCWPSSWSPPGSGCWTCRPSWRPECGCCWPGTPTRTTRMTPSRWRSPRCAPRPRARCSPRTRLAERLLSAQAPPERLVLDLGRLVFVDVAGKRALDGVDKALEAQCPVILRGPWPSVRQFFSLTGRRED